MNGYLTGSSGSVYFVVRSYGEINWLGHENESREYVRWQPLDMSSGKYLYYSGLMYSTIWLSTVSSGGWTPISSAGYVPIYSSILSQYFEGCEWTDIETNLSTIDVYYYTDNAGTGHGFFERCSTLKTANLYACSIVGESTFRDCYNLVYVNLPVCFKIGSNAFNNCRSLSSISLPACKSIGDLAFWNCSKLSVITLGSSSIVRFYGVSDASLVFQFTGITRSTGSIYVPSYLVNTYKNDSNWGYFSTRIFSIPE